MTKCVTALYALLLGLLWGQPEFWPKRILFRWQEEGEKAHLPADLEALRQWLRGQVRLRFPELPLKNPIYLLEYEADLPPAYVAKLWGHHPAVAYAEPEPLPRPLLEPERLTFIPNDVQPENYSINHFRLLGAWDSTQGDTNVVVAIVDTDVQFDHEDLVENVAYNWADPIDGQDNDGDGYTDNFRGWDVVGASYSGSGPFTPDNDPRAPTAGHGTWVAGYAGATTNNGRGIAAPAFNCRVLPVKVAPDNSWILYGAYDGILYAARKGASVINCSWGSTFYSRAAEEFISAIQQHYGSVIVAAAGNVPPDTPAVFYPAAYPGVCAVTSVTLADQWAGQQIGYHIDFAGSGIGKTIGHGNSYPTLGGHPTSFSAPQVAGALALLRAWRSDLSARQVVELLRVTADSLEPYNPSQLHYRLGRRPNLERAVRTFNLPACRVESWTLFGPPDSLPHAGETFSLRPTYKNYLSPATNLQITLHSLTPHLTVRNGSYTIDALGTLQTHTQAAPFSLEVQPSCPVDARLPLLVQFESSAQQYRDYQIIEVEGLNPGYVHLDSAYLRTTLGGNGRIGYYDPPFYRIGRGVRWGEAPTSWLAEGGLYLANDTSAHLCTRGPSGRVYAHFRPTGPAAHEVEGAYEIGRVELTDTGGTHGAKGLRIQAQAYAPRRILPHSFVAIVYRVHNPTSTGYTDLSLGWWLDFDVGDNPTQDRGRVEPSLPLIYTYNSASNRFVGAVLLSAHTPYFHIGLTDTFRGTASAYLAVLRQAGHRSLTVGDVFEVIGVQGINMAPGATDTIALALVAGQSLSELVENAQAARQWYLCWRQLSAPRVDLGPDRALCRGDSLRAEVPGAVELIWSTGTTGAVLYPEQSGRYWLLARNEAGCWGYDEVEITLRELAPAVVEFLPGLNLQVGQTLTGQETSGAPYVMSWEVETSNGWVSYNGTTFQHTFEQAGSYRVRLHRRDPNTGCSHTQEWTVRVEGSAALLLAGSASVSIYPNPTSGRFTVVYSQNLGDRRLRLRDVQGRLVWETELRAAGAVYELPSGLAEGVYHWQVGGHTGRLFYLLP
ncbi:MAG: S8 family serine peptidase [Bacteroidia bacterium]|nr:S8 family serine peptidase [Bacteroidia bacterium]MDW8088671.1 S8 family serine peptidase [Bacteroidia bacterium]